MSVVPSITVRKSSPYKGGTRIWSNRYHFTGGTPADATHWHTLMDNVTTAEKAIHPGSTTIVEALGYAAGSEVPVAFKVYSLAGTVSYSVNGTGQATGVAALTRYSTAARSTKNHPIYLYNYTHAVATTSAVLGFDKLDPNLVTAMSTFATAWMSGFSDGTITATRASPAGHVATGFVVEEYATHRDFPYQSSV